VSKRDAYICLGSSETLEPATWYHMIVLRDIVLLLKQQGHCGEYYKQFCKGHIFYLSNRRKVSANCFYLDRRDLVGFCFWGDKGNQYLQLKISCKMTLFIYIC
jgi:hypothetical protein